MKERFYKWTTSKKIVASFLFLILVGSILLSMPISQLEDVKTTYMDHLFHSVSMVCVTVNLTPSLGVSSHIIIMIMMFAGRVGPITLVDSLLRKDKFTKNITYTKGKIIIG